jgi:pimeloyl-ACP methyl ester carboxylesterase
VTHTRPAVPTAVFTPPTAVGTAHALVFAPVTPHWDEGAFFAPVIRALNRAGLRVTVVDTLALCDGTTDSLARVTARWRALLPAFGPVDLLCGNALGGAVAQALLPYVDPATAVLLVSGPARTDAVLEQRLARIADLAAAGRTAEALALLHRRVLPADAPSPGPTATRTPTRTDPEAARRLAGGLRLLCGIDVSAAVRAHPGPLLQIVGGRSQLVTLRHTAAAPHHRVHVIAGAGMRPHAEQPAAVSALVETLLRQKGLR